MATVRRRSVSPRSEAPVSRRRDRARSEDDEPEEEEEDTDATTRRPPRRRSSGTRPSAPPRSRARKDEDDEDEPEPEPEDDEEAEEEEPRARRSSKTSTSSARRRPAREEDDDEDDERPSRRSRTTPSERSNRPAGSRRSSARSERSKVPEGVHTGLSGVAEATKGAGSQDRLALSSKPQLVKFLEPEPLASYRQHWLESGGGGGGRRPYVCVGRDCPLCDIGNDPSPAIVLNLLLLSGDHAPANRWLPLGIKAWNALQEVATVNDKLQLKRGFFAVSVSGKGQRSQTNFRPVKERDLEEDWPEIFDNFANDELSEIVAEAEENVFDLSVVRTHTRKELKRVADYASEDEEDED